MYVDQDHNDAHKSKMLTVYVDGVREACPPELLMEINPAACATNPWLHNSSNFSGDEANASAIRVKQTEAWSRTWHRTPQHDI